MKTKEELLEEEKTLFAESVRIKSLISKNRKQLEELDKNPDIVKAFLKVQEEIHPKINEQILIATTALKKAEDLSEETGVGFWAAVLDKDYSYNPKSFIELWENKINKTESDSLLLQIGLRYCNYGWHTSSGRCS